MLHVPLVSNQRVGIASRQFDNPGTREIGEGYDPERSCRYCVNLAHKDGFFGCGLGFLEGRKYKSISSLKSPYPSNMAAACQSYS